MRRVRAVALGLGAHRRLWSAVSAALLLCTSPSLAEEPIPSAREVLTRAFDNFYLVDLHQNVGFAVKENGSLVLEYHTLMARKFIDGRDHTLFFITEGDRRDWKILRIEQFDRADDAFVWLPTTRRPRRFPVAQRGDKFMGLELSLEDLEIQRMEKFEVVGRSSSTLEGEPVYVVTVAPLRDSTGYDRVDFFVARSDYALLHGRFYRRGAFEPFKYFDAKREWMEHYDDHVLPRRMDFIDMQLGTQTTIEFSNRRVDPPMPQSHFSIVSLEKRMHVTRFSNSTGPDSETQAP